MGEDDVLYITQGETVTLSVHTPVTEASEDNTVSLPTSEPVDFETQEQNSPTNEQIETNK